VINSNPHLHIIAFDIPYPPNYGGTIDVFFRLKALHQIGVQIILHCFEYGQRKAAQELEKICTAVYYYPRQEPLNSLSIRQPYIIQSRRSSHLLERLEQDKYPILFEGLHSCYYLHHPNLIERLKLVRMHNIEWNYYKHLASSEYNIFKKIYYSLESKLLKRFESRLTYANYIFSISPNDHNYLTKRFAEKVIYLPAFHPHEKLQCLLGKGNYILYHGNLSVNENHQAAIFLIQKVFSTLSYPFIIAGKDPKASLQQLCQKHQIELISNPQENQMQQLIREAHINIMPTFQPTGIKLKLLNALYLGRHCLANDDMVNNTGLEKLCTIANTKEAFQQAVQNLMKQAMTQEMRNHRKQLLDMLFSNQENAQTLMKVIMNGELQIAN